VKLRLYAAIQVRLLLLLLLFKPTDTKPQAGNLGETYKIMVATAIYSVTMVFWKETVLPLCRAMERRWKRNVVSRVSSVIVVIHLPISLLLLLSGSRSSCRHARWPTGQFADDDGQQPTKKSLPEPEGGSVK